MNECNDELEAVNPVEQFKKDPEVGGGLGGMDGLSTNSTMFPSMNTSMNMNIQQSPRNLRSDFLSSFAMMKGTRLNLLLIFAPIAYIGTKSGYLGEFVCFCFAGLALIPCAERLSFVTEHVAEHTNETIGALLNATFGNAPELLISGAALKNGFYRVVQLTLLGSVLTNLLFVFGFSCLIGGLRWQTQTLRITSGNVSIGMLFVATMGTVLPTVLKLANESISSIHSTNQNSNTTDDNNANVQSDNTDEITQTDITFSRINAIIMVIGYCSYLIFQMGSHKEEFDYDGDEFAKYGGGHNIMRTPEYQNIVKKKTPARRNLFCQKYFMLLRYCPTIDNNKQHQNEHEAIPFSPLRNDNIHNTSDAEEISFDLTETSLQSCDGHQSVCSMRRSSISLKTPEKNECGGSNTSSNTFNGEGHIVSDKSDDHSDNNGYDEIKNETTMHSKNKLSSKRSDIENDSDDFEFHEVDAPIMSMRCGLIWLALVTAAISLISGIIVDTIDGFAAKSKMSEVFTSVIIIPYFSNIAEQVSAVIFAYRNKMDLCIGVTVGSAIQISQMVMPLICLFSWAMGRNMTLYFRAYETICLLLGVICVASVLQGGTTNWLVGIYLMAVYFMIAAGFYLHEDEIISVDEELE